MKTTENGFGSRARFSINICVRMTYFICILRLCRQNRWRKHRFTLGEMKKKKQKTHSHYVSHTHTHNRAYIFIYFTCGRSFKPFVFTACRMHTHTHIVVRLRVVRKMISLSSPLPIRFARRIPSTDSRGQTL